MKNKIKNTLIALMLGVFFPIMNFSKLTDDQIKKFEKTLKFGVPSARKAVLKKIEELKEEKTYSLIEYTVKNDNNDEVLILAYQLVRRFEIKGLEEYIFKTLEQTQNNNVKSQALRTLGQMKYSKAFKKALEGLKSEDAQVKSSAIFTLGELKNKKALEKLYEMVDTMDEKEEVLQEIVQAIGKIGDKKSIPKLKEILENPGYSKFVRMYVPIALAKIGSKEVAEILIKTTRNAEYLIRIRAIYALSLLKDVKIETLEKTLINALRDSDAKIRLTALKVVENLKTKKFIEYLEYIMENDPDFKVRRNATFVYAKVEDHVKVLSKFEEYIEKGNYYNRNYSVQAMEKLDISKVVPILRKNFFKLDNQTLRVSILKYLDKKREHRIAFELLTEIGQKKNFVGFSSSVHKLREKALQIIFRNGWDDAFPILQKVAEDFKDPLYLSALKMIVNLDKDNATRYYMGFLHKLKGKPFAYKFQIIKGIFKLQPKGIEDQLKVVFMNEYDSSVRSYIGRVLGTYGVKAGDLEKKYQEERKKEYQKRVKEYQESLKKKKEEREKKLKK